MSRDCPAGQFVEVPVCPVVYNPDPGGVCSVGPKPGVDLGTAGGFAILAKTGISTVPASVVTGDIGVSPITYKAMTGFSFTADATGTFATSVQVTGNAFGADLTEPTPTDLTTAVSDMETAYTNAAGRPDEFINIGAGLLGGLTLVAGTYTFDVDIDIATDLTLTGGPYDTWILRTTKNVLVAANKKITLAGGALAANIVWQVAGFVTVGAGAHMEGVILAKTKVDFITGSSLNGRILAQTAANLQVATITQPPE